MTAASIFRNRVRVQLEQRMTPQALGIVAGSLARARHEELIAQRLVSATFRRYVDGREGVPEEHINIVRPGGGTIRYVGADFAEAAAFALAYCREMSPVRTGEFQAAWLVVVDGMPWQGAIEEITTDAREIIVTNYAPFARRLEQTAGRRRPQYHITEAAARATVQRFPGMRVRRVFVAIPAGASNGTWPVPYHRKRPPGGAVLYPAVQISLKG